MNRAPLLKTARSLARGAGLCVAVALLVACGEQPQATGRISAAKKDASPVVGTPAEAFKQGSWKNGDANGWNQQLRARANYGMSDYQRVNN
jgi:hypothetical protein